MWGNNGSSRSIVIDRGRERMLAEGGGGAKATTAITLPGGRE